MVPHASSSAAGAAGACETGLLVTSGLCHLAFAFDIGFHVDLDAAERLLASPTQRERIRHRRRAPAHFNYQPPPLRITHACREISFAGFRTASSVDAVVYDFGALQVSFSVPLSGPLEDLLDLADAVYSNVLLLEESRRVVSEVLAAIRGAVTRPSVADLVEDYAIYQLDFEQPGAAIASLLGPQRELLARVLRSERGPLSSQEVDDALSLQAAFRPDDLLIIDWNAALLIDRDPADVRHVLEFANVELLEMRFLDNELDQALERAYAPRGALRRRVRAQHTDLRRIAELQVDSAVLYEEVNNALKLLGDVYLARVYRLASQRLHLAEWDASILRKLQTLESIYQKTADQRTTRRMEVLEWIIIILIAASILLPFLPGAAGH